MVAFVLAYVLRFDTGLIDGTEGLPALRAVPQRRCRSIGVLVPLAFHVQGIYRLRRGRSRIDDFFAVLVGSILAVVLGVVSTLYVQAYYVPDELKDRGAFEVSQLVWGLFLVLNVVAHLRSPASWSARRWSGAGAPGIGLKRVLVAGAGELGRRGRRQAARAPRARLPGGRLRRRHAPAATTSATAACRCSARWPRPATSCSASGSTSSTSRCRSRST